LLFLLGNAFAERNEPAAAIAVFDAPATSIVIAVVSFPFANRRMPSPGRRKTPAATSLAPSTAPSLASRPASSACCNRPKFTTVKVLRKMFLNPRFGSRRWSGVCPPSKPLSATPVRAVCPLPPRPEVLPLPDPMPRPTRFAR